MYMDSNISKTVLIEVTVTIIALIITILTHTQIYLLTHLICDKKLKQDDK